MKIRFQVSGFRDRQAPCPILSPASWRKGGKPQRFSTNRFSLLVAVMFAFLAGPSLVLAQQAKPWDQIPIPKLHEFHPQQPKRIELKNGIIIFLQEDHELPFISGSVIIPGGSRDESAAKAGLVGLYGQAWRTSGTAKMDGDAMDDLLEAKAAHIETNGDDDSTSLSWDSLKGDSDQVFSLAMDLLFHPKFSADKLQLAQEQEATGIVRRNDDEDGIADREANKLVYGVNSPYTRQPELSTIGAVTLGDLQAWHDRTLKGKLIVGIAGDFDPAAMEAKVRAAFESLPPVTPEPRDGRQALERRADLGFHCGGIEVAGDADDELAFECAIVPRLQVAQSDGADGGKFGLARVGAVDTVDELVGFAIGDAILIVVAANDPRGLLLLRKLQLVCAELRVKEQVHGERKDLV